MISIEHGVALPETGAKYPFKDMKVGDSFFVPGATGRSTLYSCARHYGVAVAVRRVDGGLRVWRIK
jgi:hypothetical protein